MNTMEGNDENLHVGMTKQAGFREMGNRRALREIKNLIGALPYPCAVSKRGLADKNDIGEKNPNLILAAARRPMTRKFAASLASKPVPCPQGTSAGYGPIGGERHKRPIAYVADSDVSDSYTAIDVDDFKPTIDLPLVQEMDDCEFEEVEMEDMEVEPLPDIDSCDKNNPLAVIDYVEDIYSFYKQNELAGWVSPNYMSNQHDINDKMRAILIDWLIEVHYKFELMEETLYLTVNIIDRFLARQSVVRKKLQLVGVTALLLACKYEEVTVPVVEDLILISDRAYAREEIFEMEKSITHELQFNFSVPTLYVFMRRFLKAAQSDKKLELLSFFMIELCLVEYQMLKFRPSLLAAAAVYTAQCTIKRFKHWTRICERHTSYSEDQLLECSRIMVDFHQKAGVRKLTGVHRKYNTLKFGCVAKSEPALFLLDRRL